MSDATNPYRDAILQIARILAPEGCQDLVERTFAESDLPDLVEACTVIGEAMPPRSNPFDGLSDYRRWRFGAGFYDARHSWAVQHSGYCQSSRPPTRADCPEIPPYRPVVGLGELVTAADLWLHRVPDGTVGRVVWTGEIDGYAETVVAWADGRSTTHPAPLRMVRAHAAPEPWAAASLASVGDPRWSLNPARRPKLERA